MMTLIKININYKGGDILGGKKNQIHVVKHPEGGWCTKKPHAQRSSSRHPTQKDAFEQAIGQAKRQGNTEVIVHGVNGKIRESNTYHRKDDPSQTKG